MGRAVKSRRCFLFQLGAERVLLKQEAFVAEVGGDMIRVGVFAHEGSAEQEAWEAMESNTRKAAGSFLQTRVGISRGQARTGRVC